MESRWDISIKGFGPFSAPSGGTIEVGGKQRASKVALYSGNGQGKTCLSRMFRAAECNDPLVDSDISKGEKSGSFEFRYWDSRISKDASKTLHIEMKRGTTATVENGTGLVFHVFNSDYVKANLEKASYSPSGDIDGYIVGKANIDTTEKKKRLSDLQDKGERLRAEIQDKIDSALHELTDQRVSKSTKEYRAITYQNLCSSAVESNCYDEKSLEYAALKSLPDDLQDIQSLQFTQPDIQYDALSSTLAAKHDRAAFADDFLASISFKIDFVSEGMRLGGKGDSCPFCGQRYNEEARLLLCQYGEYLDGREASIVNGLKVDRAALEKLRKDYINLVSDHVRIVKEFDYRKQGFSDYKGMELPELPSIDSVDMTIAQVLALIDEKCKNISVPKDPSALLTLEQLLGEISHTVIALNETIASFNAATRHASNRKTILRKELCTEMAKKVRKELDEQIQECNSTFDQYKNLNDEIQKEESLSKRDKRGAVAELFAKLLRIMFGEKYVFDKELFSIQFKQSSLDTDAERVMSDGEKTIVAFCFFIASTYELLSYDDDAQRLFFVIDDPISSLDYHFVYSVAQSIKSLGGYFGIESSNLRLLVMTHNSAFFNMLCRNNIVNGRFLMRNGTIEKADKAGVVHYFDHLKDINDALHDGDISHTIGNSIRQVLEAIWHFDAPKTSNLFEYLNSSDCSELDGCEFIFLLCNDQSHGASALEYDLPVDEDGIKRACSAVLQLINRRFPGQLIAAGIEVDNIQGIE